MGHLQGTKTVSALWPSCTTPGTPTGVKEIRDTCTSVPLQYQSGRPCYGVSRGARQQKACNIHALKYSGHKEGWNWGICHKVGGAGNVTLREIKTNVGSGRPMLHACPPTCLRWETCRGGNYLRGKLLKKRKRTSGKRGGGTRGKWMEEQSTQHTFLTQNPETQTPDSKTSRLKM